MTESFTQEWKDWIATNRSRGCDVKEMFNILLRNGFSPQLIRQELKDILIDDEEIILADQYILASSIERLHYWLRDDWLYLPFAERLDYPDIEAYTMDAFLSDDECDRLTGVIEESTLRPSGTTRPHPDQEFRTSSSCDLVMIDDPFVKEIDSRMARTLGIHPVYSEFMEGQVYQVGQQFKPHPDYFDDVDYADHCIPQGQRTWTFMVYLNEPERGGETRFLDGGPTIKPKKGMALVWNNLNSYGDRNRKAMHQGLPVEKGRKVVITKWFRQFPRESVIIKTPGEYIRPLTRTGWRRMEIPADLFKRIRDYYHEHRNDSEAEFVPGGYVHGHADSHSSEVAQLPDTTKAQVLAELKPLMEEWAGVPLEPVTVYGIRTYLPGAMLAMHRDRIETHIASAVLNIDQDVDEDWALQIEDHHYRTHRIILEPGEMLLYEGGRLRHGRPDPLKGRSFANVFAHYKPADS